jgi:hypothetical protein
MDNRRQPALGMAKFPEQRLQPFQAKIDQPRVQPMQPRNDAIDTGRAHDRLAR